MPKHSILVTRSALLLMCPCETGLTCVDSGVHFADIDVRALTLQLGRNVVPYRLEGFTVRTPWSIKLSFRSDQIMYILFMLRV